MKESNYRMDNQLDQFERELRSLTPKSNASLSKPAQVNGVGISSTLDLATHDDGSPLAIPQSGNQLTIPTLTRSNWWKTVAVAWSSGLAVGLLLSAIWTRSNTGELDTGRDLVGNENFASANVHSPTGLDSEMPSLVESATPEGMASSTRSNPWQYSQSTRLRNTLRGSRYVVTQGGQPDVLRPFSQLYDIANDWRFTNSSSSRELFNQRTQENPQLPDTPNSAPSELMLIPPAQQSAPPNQRQLLQSLYQSEFRI